MLYLFTSVINSILRLSFTDLSSIKITKNVQEFILLQQKGSLLLDLM